MSKELPEDVQKAISDYADCRDRKDAVISDCIFGYSLRCEVLEKDMQDSILLYNNQITTIEKLQTEWPQ